MIYVILVAAIIVVISIVIFVVMAIYDGYREVKQTPRVNAFSCNVHGPISPDEVITFVDTPACGICWWERFKEAGEGTGAFK